MPIPVTAMPRRYCTKSFLAAALAVALHALAPTAVAAGDEAAQGPIDAIWRIERFDFIYHSTRVFYSCDTLPEKIRAILRAIGAHSRIAVEIECGARFINYAFVKVTLAVPAEANQENVLAATTYDARAMLVARLRNVRLPTATDLPRFPATWQTVSLSTHLRLGPGDCDLLRGMRDHVFPRLSVRIAGAGLRCTPGGATRLRPRVEVSALLPLPPATPARNAS